MKKKKTSHRETIRTICVVVVVIIQLTQLTLILHNFKFF